MPPQREKVLIKRQSWEKWYQQRQILLLVPINSENIEKNVILRTAAKSPPPSSHQQ